MWEITPDTPIKCLGLLFLSQNNKIEKKVTISDDFPIISHLAHTLFNGIARHVKTLVKPHILFGWHSGFIAHVY